jgi:hypothetical protein
VTPFVEGIRASQELRLRDDARSPNLRIDQSLLRDSARDHAFTGVAAPPRLIQLGVGARAVAGSSGHSPTHVLPANTETA